MQFSQLFLALFALVASASAFVPAPAASRMTAVKPLQMGYIPDGLSEAEYKKVQAAEKKKAEANKKKKRGSVETLTEWQARTNKKFPNQPGKGHTFVKIRESK